MPKATIQGIEPKTYNLKSISEGFVKMRRMSYGQWLTRQELMMEMQLQEDKGKQKGSLNLANREVTLYEFRNTIIDHNLTDDDDNKLNFASEQTFLILDPRVGNEISDLITKLHEPYEDAEKDGSQGGNSEAESTQ